MDPQRWPRRRPETHQNRLRALPLPHPKSPMRQPPDPSAPNPGPPPPFVPTQVPPLRLQVLRRKLSHPNPRLHGPRSVPLMRPGRLVLLERRVAHRRVKAPGRATRNALPPRRRLRLRRAPKHPPVPLPRVPDRRCLQAVSRSRLRPVRLCRARASRSRRPRAAVVVVLRQLLRGVRADPPVVVLRGVHGQEDPVHPEVASVVPVVASRLQAQAAQEEVRVDVPAAVAAPAVLRSAPVARVAGVAAAKNSSRWTCPPIRRQVLRCRRAML